jgi:transcriptional regulator with XRE-family HTH domain
MGINELKKELGLTQKDIAQFFNMTYGAFANSSAKKRYEDALCKFYGFVKARSGEGLNK